MRILYCLTPNPTHKVAPQSTKYQILISNKTEPYPEIAHNTSSMKKIL